MLYLTESDVRRLLPMPTCIEIMRNTFRALSDGTALNQPRRRLHLPTGAVLHQMAGAVGDYFGTKIYSAHAKHGAHFWFHLFDAKTAEPLALMEANWLGQIRTGAASGYATDLLARPDSSAVGVIGSGFQARSQIEAMLAVRAIQSVKVWSRDERRRKSFAEECLANFRVAVRAVDTAEEAVREADIVVTATFAKDPVLDDSWIRPGTHINAMGSNNPQRRELPAALIARADQIVVDSIEQARIESGDLLLVWSAADWSNPRLVELEDATLGRLQPEHITIFKSNGLGVEDVAAGAYVYERARAAGIGRSFYS
jgi:ornithine cyclodeaminase/alanine dehydrogenase-like protein (mu-crystallin family)